MVRKKVSPGEPTEFTKPVFDQCLANDESEAVL